MKITVIGASAGTGVQVANRLGRDGHQVVALSRRGPQSPPEPGVTPQRGDATERDDVCRAVAGADAVVMTLGARASDRSEPRARATRVMVETMQASGVRRLVVQSSLGVGDSHDLLPWFTKRLVVPLFLRRAFADHLAQERIVRASPLNWTILRPGYLGNGAPSPYVAGFTAADRRVTAKLSRADVADFVSKSLMDPTTYGQAIALGGVRH
ncbi:MAG: NAD(P)-dependent oxidoreductase [Nocardioides sp.]